MGVRQARRQAGLHPGDGRLVRLLRDDGRGEWALEAASAVGYANCGTPLGGAIAGPLVGFMAVAFGWRVSFVAIGILGFVWLGFWMYFATKKPREHPSISPERFGA